MLAVEVEYLTGVVRAANDRGDAADWPPQPDRLFSALVATWGAHAEPATERRALEWLECQPAPRIEACEHAPPRSVVAAYVPPNDIAAGQPGLIPDWRRRQERRFPACIPERPLVRMLWPDAPEPAVLDALVALAHDTSYLGHSASLVRCHAFLAEGEAAQGETASRVAYPGRLAELERAFSAKRRPSPGAALPRPSAKTVAPIVPASVFGTEWLVFRHEGGTLPDTVAAAIAAKTLLKTVQAGYGTGAAPPWVSGHAADGAPLDAPHLACVPLLDVGWEWSQGGLMGLALILPRAMEAAVTRARDPDAATVAPDDDAAGAAETALLRAVAKQRRGEAATLELRLAHDLCWAVTPDRAPAAQSLRPHRYATTSRVWGTITPIALDRHPHQAGDVEATIAAACQRIGLPRPRLVVPHKHSAASGAVPAWRRRGAPAWTTWRLPPSLAGRKLTHAVIDFEAPVAGPVILGAGRFCGLGLCLPLDASA